jgi:hypothetical protein
MLNCDKLLLVVTVISYVAAISWILQRELIVALGQWCAAAISVGVLFRHLCGNPETHPSQHP